jgi:hypothetical protein
MFPLLSLRAKRSNPYGRSGCFGASIRRRMDCFVTSFLEIYRRKCLSGTNFLMVSCFRGLPMMAGEIAWRGKIILPRNAI